MKPQEIRLIDVAVLGPFMMWFGARAQELHPAARLAMVLAGFGTVAYNWRNFKIRAGMP